MKKIDIYKAKLENTKTSGNVEYSYQDYTALNFFLMTVIMKQSMVVMKTK